MYGTHNFFAVAGKEVFGAFFDSAAKVEFDVGFTHLDELVITADDADVYLIEGGSVDEIR